MTEISHKSLAESWAAHIPRKFTSTGLLDSSCYMVESRTEIKETKRSRMVQAGQKGETLLASDNSAGMG